jgi:vacuolar protein sorting-associated protein 51
MSCFLVRPPFLPRFSPRDAEPLTEIRELDGERQSLVYNHHHELIAASDTIAAVLMSYTLFLRRLKQESQR